MQLMQVKRVMAKFDQDGDGRLDFDEFQKSVILPKGWALFLLSRFIGPKKKDRRGSAVSVVGSSEDARRGSLEVKVQTRERRGSFAIEIDTSSQRRKQ
jgi:hypothetical protein